MTVRDILSTCRVPPTEARHLVTKINDLDSRLKALEESIIGELAILYAM